MGTSSCPVCWPPCGLPGAHALLTVYPSCLNVVGGDLASSSVGMLPLALGFVSAFLSGLLACRLMIALVKKAKLKWFALYCLLAGSCALVCGVLESLWII